MENRKKKSSVEPWMCGECRHMRPYGGYKSAQVDSWLMRGECRRFPPQPLVLDAAAKVDADMPFELHGVDDGYDSASPIDILRIVSLPEVAGATP